MIYGNKSAILIVNELHFYYFVDILFVINYLKL